MTANETNKTNKPGFNGEWVKLGDVCEINSGGTPKRTVSEYWRDGTIPWVKISDMKQKRISSTEEMITEEGLAHSAAKRLEPGTLLFSIFASIGAVGILSISASTNQAIASLKIKDSSVDANYLYHWLKGQEAVTKKAARGVAQSNINLSILRSMVIPVPTKEIQQSIAYRFDLIDEQIDKARQLQARLDNLVKSQFVEIFGEIQDSCTLSRYIRSLVAGKSLAGDCECSNLVLKTGAVSRNAFDGSEVKKFTMRL